MAVEIETTGFRCKFDYDCMSEEECQMAVAILHEMSDMVEEFGKKYNRGYKIGEFLVSYGYTGRKK